MRETLTAKGGDLKHKNEKMAYRIRASLLVKNVFFRKSPLLVLNSITTTRLYRYNADIICCTNCYIVPVYNKSTLSTINSSGSSFGHQPCSVVSPACCSNLNKP